MPLQTGDWEIDGNGSRGVLAIQAIDAQGRLNATVYGQRVVGWWDEQRRRITFLRLINPNDPTSFQSFRGYGWDEDPNTTGGKPHYLAGSFETYAGAGGTAARPSYGWFAFPGSPFFLPLAPEGNKDMPLQTGDWEIDANGSRGVLAIQAIDAQGRLNATVYGERVVGWWDEQDRRITFLRLINPNDPTSFQSFSGYGWEEHPNMPGGTHHYLAGSFETYAGAGGIAARPSYGWFAVHHRTFLPPPGPDF